MRMFPLSSYSASDSITFNRVKTRLLELQVEAVQTNHDASFLTLQILPYLWLQQPTNENEP